MIDNEDYLGITALALSRLAEDFVKSRVPEDVKPVLSSYITKATSDWSRENSKGTKQWFLEQVKSSINESVNWTQKRKYEWRASNHGR
ncbi:MAG: hypothetical protein ACKPEN_01615 [Planktothrix sp.]|uniref:hypothetical protein n=1 Tax=Planktothrix sp. TaxID=3088171 RepID=UPI0038D4F52C